MTLREHVDLSYPLLTDTLPCFTPEPPQYETKTFCGSGPKVDEAKSMFFQSLRKVSDGHIVLNYNHILMYARDSLY